MGGKRPMNPQVVVTDRGKQMSNRLGSYSDIFEGIESIPREVHDTSKSTKGALEPITPRLESKSIESPLVKPSRPTVPSTQRETRAQASLKKNIPFLEYTAPSRKGKITIYNDDLNRLNDEEFLNDTIIEFYLTYIPFLPLT
jgi:Ulp1 family protease